MRFILISLFSLVFSSSAIAFDSQYFEGTHYEQLQTPVQTEGNIEVIEFFWFGCPHCYQFEPYIQKWKKTKPDNVDFYRIPVIWNRANVKLHAQSYFALRQMGYGDDIDAFLFDALQVKKLGLRNQEQMEAYLATIKVDINKYRSAMKSFDVDVKMRRAKKLAEAYKISGVPTVIVDKHYRILQAADYNETIAILNDLIRLAQSNRDAAKSK